MQGMFYRVFLLPSAAAQPLTILLGNNFMFNLCLIETYSFLVLPLFLPGRTLSGFSCLRSVVVVVSPQPSPPLQTAWIDSLEWPSKAYIHNEWDKNATNEVNLVSAGQSLLLWIWNIKARANSGCLQTLALWSDHVSIVIGPLLIY